jgi:choline-glycine betaine transporter
MCVNWKVVGGVVAVAAGMVLFAPTRVAALAPLMVVAVCPLSMLLMMRYMHGPKSSQVTDLTDRTEIERLRSEVAELRQQRSDRTPT